MMMLCIVDESILVGLTSNRLDDTTHTNHNIVGWDMGKVGFINSMCLHTVANS
jgi:hypothetical protein